MEIGKRRLGQTPLEVTVLGLGCMGLSEFYGPPTDEREGVALLHEALDQGINFFDTAEMYGMGRNEQLVGRAFSDRRDHVVIATKFGPQRDPRTGRRLGVDGSPASVRRSVEGSLERLQTDIIDLYYLHRVDPATPIEDTVGAMARLVEEGKVRALGLSEAGAHTLRRAHAIHPLAALQSEYSLFSRHLEADILPTCRELGISLVAYSPLGRGILAGRWTGGADRPQGEGEFRTGGMQPRYSEENFPANLALVDVVKSVANRHGATPGQVALSWVLSRGQEVVAIPGTTRPEHLSSNLGALQVKLDAEDLRQLDGLARRVRGERYGLEGMKAVEA